MIQVEINIDIGDDGTTKLNVNILKREDAKKEENVFAA